MDTLLKDIRFAVRALRRSPGFMVVAVVTLALGIGINATVFSVVHSVALNPVPQVNKDGLVMLTAWSEKQGDVGAVSWPNFQDWTAATRSFEGMAAYADRPMVLTGTGGEPEEVPVELVSPNLFSLLQVKPLLGRAFVAGEGVRGRHHSVILTHTAWQRRFNSDRGVVGRALTLNGQAHTIVGVMPARFGFPDNQQFWVPMVPPLEPDRGSHDRQVVARLRPGVSLPQAQAELDGISRELAARYPETNEGRGVRALDFTRNWSGEVGGPMMVMMGAVAFVLLIACANVASLLLARAASRRREIAVRAALGAGRGRIVRQLLTESMVLAVLGGALGVPLAQAGLGAIRGAFPFDPPFWLVLEVNGAVLLFVSVVSLGTGIVFGLVPALRATEGDLQGTLRGSGRGTTGGVRRGRLQRALVAGQLALSLVLLVGATLMVRSMVHLQGSDPGFDARNALAASMLARGARYDSAAARAALFRESLDRVRALPGVRAAGLASAVPLIGGVNTSALSVEGREVPVSERPAAEVREVSEGFVEAMGLRLLAGRGVSKDEAASGAPVAVVSRALARQMWPGQSALGRQVSTGGAFRTVVGVVGDVSTHYQGGRPRLQVYLPMGAQVGGRMNLVVRTAGDPAGLAPAVRRAVHGVDATVPVELVTMGEAARNSLWRARLFGGMFTSFGVIALLLAVAGVYAVMAYAVAQRTHEIGVRMALGARTRQVLRLVVGDGMRVACAGVALGLLGAFGLTRLMAGMVEGVSPNDPFTFAAVPVVLGGAVLLASWLPARRAARVDPMVALRSE
jgi:predicted permease